MEFLRTWPLSAWLAVLPLAGNALWKPGLALLRLVRGQAAADVRRVEGEVDRLLSEIGRQTARINDLEDLIDLLRKALDRHLMRESAIASACEMLITLASLVQHPTDAMLRIRDRAQLLLEDARAQTTKDNARGNG